MTVFFGVMDNDKHDKDVLSLESEDEDFSGFSSFEDEVTDVTKKGKAPKNSGPGPVNSKAKGSKKSSASATKASGSGTKKQNKKKSQNKNDKAFDLSALSAQEIEQLKSLLGTSASLQPDDSLDDDGPVLYYEVQVPPQNDQEVDQIMDPNVAPNFQDALFQSEHGSVDLNVIPIEVDIDWSLPKLKTPDRGEPISESLAGLIVRACNNLCQTSEIVDKYKVPSNCEAMCPPSVNEEVWVDLNKVKKVQSTDKSFKEIQGLVTASMLPLLELAKVVRPFIANAPEIKTYISEILTLIGQVQFNLSLRRRYLMKPYLKGQFQALCNMKTPISTMLYGDDIQKEIKKCETAVKIGKFVPNSRRSFGRGAARYSRPGYQGQVRGLYRGKGRGAARYQPYQNQWSQAQLGFGGPYGQFGHQHQGRRKAPTATVTSATAQAPAVAANMNPTLN